MSLKIRKNAMRRLRAAVGVLSVLAMLLSVVSLPLGRNAAISEQYDAEVELLDSEAKPAAEVTSAATENAPTEAPAEAPQESPTAPPDMAPIPQPSGGETETPSPEPTAWEDTSLPSCEPTEPAELILAPESFREKNQKLGTLQYLDGGMRIPVLYQYDYRTTIATWGEKEISVATSGCGPTAVSMVIAYLTGDRNQTPYTLLRLAIERDMYREGLGHSSLSKLASQYGVESKWISTNADKVLDALNSGHPVIAHMGEGTFTDDGHYIVLRGVAEDGSIYVTDPNSSSRSKKTYPLSLILSETKTSDPFMVCTGPDGYLPDMSSESEPTETLAPEETIEPSATPDPFPTLEPDEVLEPTETPDPFATLEPDETIEPSTDAQPVASEYVYEDDLLYAKATLADASLLPADAALHITVSPAELADFAGALSVNGIAENRIRQMDFLSIRFLKNDELIDVSGISLLYELRFNGVLGDCSEAWVFASGDAVRADDVIVTEQGTAVTLLTSSEPDFVIALLRPVNEQTVYSYSDESMTVTAELSDPSAVPSGAQLVVTPVDSDLYAPYLETSADAVSATDTASAVQNAGRSAKRLLHVSSVSSIDADRRLRWNQLGVYLDCRAQDHPNQTNTRSDIAFFAGRLPSPDGYGLHPCLLAFFDRRAACGGGLHRPGHREA